MLHLLLYIYQELKKPVEKKKTKKSLDLVVRIIADPEPPPFCPSGGDSPGMKMDPLPAPPELPLPAVGYAEIKSKDMSVKL